MCAVRFGSYSIDSTTAGDVELVALEIDDAVSLLVTAADVARGDAAVVVAATALAARLGEVLDRLVAAGDFLEAAGLREAQRRREGTEGFKGHGVSG